jgi:hypothetical protein
MRTQRRPVAARQELAAEERELEEQLERERLEQDAAAKALAAEYGREHYNQDPPPGPTLARGRLVAPEA